MARPPTKFWKARRTVWMGLTIRAQRALQVGREPSWREEIPGACHPHPQGTPLPGVAQSGSEAVDGKVDAALHARLGVPRPVAPQELQLQVVQGIEVGEAVADGACERGVRLEEAGAAGDREERLHRRIPF